MIAFADVTSFCYCLSCTHLLCDYLSYCLSLSLSLSLFISLSLFLSLSLYFSLSLSLSFSYFSIFWLVMLVDCMLLFMVGFDRYLSAFLYSLTCFTILQNVSPSFGVLLLFSKSEGGFSCPCVLTAREIGPNEVVSLLVWRGIS